MKYVHVFVVFLGFFLDFYFIDIFNFLFCFCTTYFKYHVCLDLVILKWTILPQAADMALLHRLVQLSK